MGRLPLFFVLAFGTCIVLQSCAVHEKRLQESGAKLLTQRVLEQLFSEKQTVEYSADRGPGTITYFPGGKENIKFGDVSDEGGYRIENGQFCSKWHNVAGGKEHCYRIYYVAKQKYEWVNLDGSFGGLMFFK